MAKTKKKKSKDDEALYVPALEVTKYLTELQNVLTAIASGLEESKQTLITKGKEAKAKGDADDGDKN